MIFSKNFQTNLSYFFLILFKVEKYKYVKFS